jgi:hypothetical protein
LTIDNALVFTKREFYCRLVAGRSQKANGNFKRNYLATCLKRKKKAAQALSEGRPSKLPRRAKVVKWIAKQDRFGANSVNLAF